MVKENRVGKNEGMFPDGAGGAKIFEARIIDSPPIARIHRVFARTSRGSLWKRRIYIRRRGPPTGQTLLPWRLRRNCT